MQILPSRSERTPDLLEQLLNLVANGCVAGSNHFRDQQARQNPVLLRYMAANGETGAFFTAKSDLVFPNELPDVLETDRGLENSLPGSLLGWVQVFGSRRGA